MRFGLSSQMNFEISLTRSKSPETSERLPKAASRGSRTSGGRGGSARSALRPELPMAPADGSNTGLAL